MHNIMGVKYKPVVKKVIPISTYDPDTVIPEYMPLELKELPLLTMNPRKMEDIVFTERLTKEHIEMIIRNIPNGFLRKAELELILDIIFKFENAFAFMHGECSTFNTKYYPEYTMRMVPHVLWQFIYPNQEKWKLWKYLRTNVKWKNMNYPPHHIVQLYSLSRRTENYIWYMIYNSSTMLLSKMQDYPCTWKISLRI